MQAMDEAVPNSGVRAMYCKDPEKDSIPMERWREIILFNIIQPGIKVQRVPQFG